MVGVSASINLLLHHKVQKFCSGTGSPGWSREKAVKQLCVCVCMLCIFDRYLCTPLNADVIYFVNVFTVFCLHLRYVSCYSIFDLSKFSYIYYAMQ